MYPLQKMPSTNAFNEMCVKISLRRSLPKNVIAVCNAVYFRLCIDLMHILPPVTAEGFDGSHHPRFTECYLSSLGMLGTTQLNIFADHIIFTNGHMKHAHSWQRMTNNNNDNKGKQV